MQLAKDSANLTTFILTFGRYNFNTLPQHKSTFRKRWVQVLNEKGISPDPDKVQAIQNLTSLTNI